jgi:hypothetical protein
MYSTRARGNRAAAEASSSARFGQMILGEEVIAHRGVSCGEFTCFAFFTCTSVQLSILSDIRRFEFFVNAYQMGLV